MNNWERNRIISGATLESGSWGRHILVTYNGRDLNSYDFNGNRIGEGQYMSRYQEEKADEIAKKAASQL